MMSAAVRTSSARKSGGVFPKITPLPGSLHAEYKRCGRATCRCARTDGGSHGPYWYRRWWQEGRLRRRYVPARELDRTRTMIEEYRRLHPRAWQVRQQLAGLSRLVKESNDG
jgi:hypothetical protein